LCFVSGSSQNTVPHAACALESRRVEAHRQQCGVAKPQTGPWRRPISPLTQRHCRQGCVCQRPRFLISNSKTPIRKQEHPSFCRASMLNVNAKIQRPNRAGLKLNCPAITATFGLPSGLRKLAHDVCPAPRESMCKSWPTKSSTTWPGFRLISTTGPLKRRSSRVRSLSF